MNVFLQNQESRNDSQRRKRAQRVLKQVQQLSFIVLAWLLGIAALYGAYVLVMDRNLLTIQQVVVEGELSHLTADEVRALANIPEDSNLFQVAMADVQKKVSQHPWVAEVAVRRKLPHTLWIYVTEREPAAILLGKAAHYIDAKGQVFTTQDEVLEDLPVMTGFIDAAAEDLMRGLQLMADYQRHPLAAEFGLSEMHFDAAQGFSIVGNALPVVIRLGWDGFGKKLDQFAALWPAMRSRGATPLYVDTNVSGKVIAKYDN